MARLFQRLLLFAKEGIDQGEIARQLSRIDWDNRVGRWFHGRDRARKGSAGLVVLTGKFLAPTDQHQCAGIVRKCWVHVLLNVSDCFVEMSLVVKLARSREAKGIVLGIRRSFSKDLSGFVEPALRLEAESLSRECGLIPGRHLKDAINYPPRFVVTTDTLE